MPRLLVDTGPLVAWFDGRDAHHHMLRAFMADFRGELVSTWPVLTEVCHLLPESSVPAFMRWVGSGGLTVADVPSSAIRGLADRMDKYADLPMDLADASLIWLAEATGVLDILTLDRRDFGVYRTERGKALRNALDASTPPKQRPTRRKPTR
jgi:uncharacterized protein